MFFKFLTIFGNEVGFVQGINFIAAGKLFHPVEDSPAFWL